MGSGRTMVSDSGFVSRTARGRISDAEFDADRAQILASWPTGADVDFDIAVQRHKTLPPAKDAAKLFRDAYASGRPLIYPRTGEADIDRHIATLNYLHSQGAELLCTHADSYTRTQRYQAGEEALAESLRRGSSLLNGVPVVNYGPDRTADIVTRTPGANQFRTGTPDARLSAEVVLAAGFGSLLGGILGTSIPFMSKMTVGRAVRNWQYVERLIGRYEESGVSIHREYYGALMGMVMPPSVMISCLVFDALIAAEQGVKHMALGVNNNLNICQDVATIKVLGKLAAEYLGRFGYTEALAVPIMHMWMGPFPQGEADAFAVIAQGALTAAYAGSGAVIVKTADEAFGTPSAQANAEALKLTRTCVDLVAGQGYPDSEEFRLEMNLIEAETRAILDTALEASDGAIGPAIEFAFATGILDVPLAPAQGNAGKTITVRDASGAVRFYDTGNLPFSEDIKQFHRDRVAERAAREDTTVNYKLVLRDISMKMFDLTPIAEVVNA
jgi:methylaspartate mutase epsilon subunit